MRPGRPCTSALAVPPDESSLLDLARRIAARLVTGTCVAGLGLAAAPAFAKVLTVTDFDDTSDNGVCDATCTLRDAIDGTNGANNSAGPDIVKFKGLTSPATITLAGNDINIEEAVTITGPGAGMLAVSGANASRAFFVDPGAGDDVKISGLRFIFGSANVGGAIHHVSGDLILDEVDFRNNTASVHGGALYTDGMEATLTLTNSRVTANAAAATDSGGGIFIGYTHPDAPQGAVIRNTVFSGNSTGMGGGGGIFLSNPQSPVLIENSTFFNNQSDGGGAGLGINGTFDRAHVTVRNSTFYSNDADTNGGGVYIIGLEHPIVFENCTISANTAGADGGGVHLPETFGLVRFRNVTLTANEATDEGGGIFVNVSSPVLLQNTVLDGNQASTSADGDDLFGDTFFAESGMVQSVTGATVVGGIRLPLGSFDQGRFGGRTRTVAPLPGEPVVDMGDPAVCSIVNGNKDQRGVARQDGDSDGNTVCDIGSYEWNGRVVPCSSSPLMGCEVFSKGSLSIVNKTGSTADTLSAAITAGTTPDTTFFGDPTFFTGRANAVCIYAGLSGELVGSLNVPAGGNNSLNKPLWKLLSGGKTAYALTTGNVDGVTSMTQAPSLTGTSAVTIKAKSPNLTVPFDPAAAMGTMLTPPVLVQNVMSNGDCVQVELDTGDITVNKPGQFTAVK